MTDWRTISLLGIDVGFSKRRATTGVAIHQKGELQQLCRIASGSKSRKHALQGFANFDAIAIDGPILPPNGYSK